MKSFSDLALTAISRKLRDIDFEPDDSLDHAADSLSVMHGVQLFPVNKKNPGAPREYAVTLYVAGKQRIIGKTKWRAAACRFADMARMRFYKFKQRGAIEPKDDDLNFSVTQAKSDLHFETAAVALLNEVEAHFREKGFWKDRPGKEVRDKKSERWTTAKAVRDHETRLQALEELHDNISRRAKKFELRLDVPQCAKETFQEAKQITDPIAELLPIP